MKTPAADHPGLGMELAKVIGIGSSSGHLMLSQLEDHLIAAADREQVLKEWQAYMGTTRNQGSLPAATWPGGRLTEVEALMCRQLYYALVVSTIGVLYLQRGGGLSPGSIEPDLIINTLLMPVKSPTAGPSGASAGGETMPFGSLAEVLPPITATLASILRDLDFSRHATGDLFRPLYENLIPARVRHRMGEHYTPEWLAMHILDQVGYDGQAESTLIDPACGSGVFLVEALRRKTAQSQKTCRDWTIVGMDVNPLAVLAARVNYMMALGQRGGEDAALKLEEIPVYLGDVLLGDEDGLWRVDTLPFAHEKFDLVVGNPPWVNWESLSPEYRLATLALWKRYGLFSHSGMDTILGSGKKDLSTLVTLSSASQFLKPGGKMAYLITQSVFKSGGAAEGFRDFRLPGGGQIKVTMVEDLSRCRPFAGASNRTAIIYLENRVATTYPVPYFLWTNLSYISRGAGQADRTVIPLVAEPVDAKDATSPWITYRRSCRDGLRKILGSSPYRAREGANTGGANGILWVEVVDRPGSGLVRVRNLAEAGRKKVAVTEAVIEETLVYPLLKGNDLDRWRAHPSASIILTQDPLTRRGISLGVMARSFPRTLAYLEQYEHELRNRAAYRRYFREDDPFYSMFNVGEYTLGQYKTVWHRLGDRMKAAVVEGGQKPIIPQETHTLVACESRDEAWYLAGVLNSLPVEYTLSSYSMVGGKSFAGPNLLEFIRVPLYTASPLQVEIVRIACQVAGGSVPDSSLTEAVARLFGLGDSELNEMRKGWEEIGLTPLAFHSNRVSSK